MSSINKRELIFIDQNNVIIFTNKLHITINTVQIDYI